MGFWDVLESIKSCFWDDSPQTENTQEESRPLSYAEAGMEAFRNDNWELMDEDEKIELSGIENKSTPSITKDLEIVKDELIANDIEKILYYDLTRPELDVSVVRVIIPEMELYALDPSRAGYRFLKV